MSIGDKTLLAKASELSVAVMAGGKSSRMGTDKSFVPLLGKPMVEHVLGKVADLGQETILIANKPEKYSYLGLPVFTDIFKNSGPLGGLHTALSNANYPFLLIVACDMPWLNRSLLEFIVSLRNVADVVVPRWYEYPEPLHAVYSKDCLPAVERELVAGNLKTISFYDSVKVRYVGRDEISHYDPRGISFANINSPEDLRKAEYRK